VRATIFLITRIATLDKLNEHFSANIGFGGLQGLDVIVVTFPGPRDLSSMSRIYKRTVAEIVEASPTYKTSTGMEFRTDIDAHKISDGWRLVFKSGDGKVYHVIYRPDIGEVTMVDRPKSSSKSGGIDKP